MTTTNHDKSTRLQLSGRNIAGACLAVCGLLLIIWGGTLQSVNVTDPDFMSFAVSGLVTVATGVCLATAPPPAARVALIWLATLTSMLFLFIIGMEVIVSLMSCVMIAGIATWLTIKILR
ncbi:hypothetical protein E4J66_08610 [Actinomyces viscosus]|uniref:Uncharacterized protein n=1 Tax=Actinomyces viscosus TaxID=1656 RepID=A0A3S4WIZ5_ACTVI|nr:hypothetical protein [Actinomyces viscosus]TFH52268.1 hypothetical protein E4J66_08610 [Actinomyces viscosus]VEI15073.1 Uncharacterised protein [Actinomyces viscosus]